MITDFFAKLREEPGDAFAILQLPVHHDHCFRSYGDIDGKVDYPSYNFVYCGALKKSDMSVMQKLEGLFHIFNVKHPEDFEGHSMSVSDIVVLKLEDKISFFFCDSWGFTQLNDAPSE